jgi:hypothetical protein
MDDDAVFSEKQFLKKIYRWLIILLINGPLLFLFIWQVIFRHVYPKPISNEVFATIIFGMLFLTAFIQNLHLHTVIRKDGVYVRFYPLQFAYKKYEWNTITKAFVREYQPVREFGGWGIRFAGTQYGKAYSLSGNKGIQLIFQDGQKLLIGTLKPVEAQAALSKLYN